MKKLNAYELMGLLKAKQIEKQKGATMVEYALVIAGVAVVAGIIFAGDGPVYKMINDFIGGITLQATTNAPE